MDTGVYRASCCTQSTLLSVPQLETKDLNLTSQTRVYQALASIDTALSSPTMRPRTAAGLVVGLVAQVLATAKLPPANEGQTFAFDTVFGVDFSTDANGGCKSHKDKLQTSHVEAISTLTAAKGSIDWLSQHKKAPSSSNKELYNNWLRVRQTYQKVLGTDPWTAAGGLAQEVNAVRRTLSREGISKCRLMKCRNFREVPEPAASTREDDYTEIPHPLPGRLDQVPQTHRPRPTRSWQARRQTIHSRKAHD